jgi:hypothetical protein
MLDFEKERYDAACAAFAAAFLGAYASGEAALARGEAELEEVAFPLIIDIPKNAVLDDVWQSYELVFRQAGHTAAVARGRTAPAQLDSSHTHPDLTELALTRGLLRWIVFAR